MKYCPKHDIHGEQCWCCEEEGINAKGPEHRAKMYNDPQFLARRGGTSAAAQFQANAVVAKLSQLSAEQLDRLLTLATGGAVQVTPVANGKRTVVSAVA